MIRELCDGVASGRDRNLSTGLDGKEGRSVWSQDSLRMSAMTILQLVVKSVTISDAPRSFRYKAVRMFMKNVWMRSEGDAKEGMKKWREVRETLSEEDVSEILIEHASISTLRRLSLESKNALTALGSF